MGNTIDWGQAAVNNTIGFGDGAENNTIGWGDIQADSWSPETNLTGIGGTPAFANTYSLLFDEAMNMYFQIQAQVHLQDSLFYFKTHHTEELNL